MYIDNFNPYTYLSGKAIDNEGKMLMGRKSVLICLLGASK